MNPIAPPAVAEVAALRRRVAAAGFRPVAVRTGGKAPVARGWPHVDAVDALPGALNTGIATAGLWGVDIDVDDPTLADQVAALAVSILGPAPARLRSNSPRRLVLYRAADGEPGRLAVKGAAGKVEVLGTGEQFVAFGTHPSGAAYTWDGAAPGDFTRAELPAVTEADVAAFLAEVSPVLGAMPAGRAPPAATAASLHGAAAPLWDVAAALGQIPNGPSVDWDAWNRIGMATHAATGGSAGGLEVWMDWSATNPLHDATTTAARWAHFATSPASAIGAGTLFELAKQAAPDWRSPSHEALAMQGAAICDRLLAGLAERGHPAAAGYRAASGAPHDWPDSFLNELCAHTWAALDVVSEARLLGELVTPTARVFLIGSTGLGKTQLGHAMAAGMASGHGFLHWRSERPSRVLVMDGEMPVSLLKERASAALRRDGRVTARNLMIFARDRAEDWAARYSALGMFQALNTKAGRDFMMRLLDMAKPDVVIFDNVMSLIDGDQKDEVPWSETLPLVSAITSRSIGQVWLDHTGHDRTRQYGSSTKAWRFDAVGIMSPEETQERGEVAFTLHFEAPAGKARRRTPGNWRDFAPHVIRLAGDEWTSAESEHAGTQTARAPRGEAVPRKAAADLAYDRLIDVIAKSGMSVANAEIPSNVRVTLLDDWREAVYASGIIDDGYDNDQRRKAFHEMKRTLMKRGQIACHRQWAWPAWPDEAPQP